MIRQKEPSSARDPRERFVDLANKRVTNAIRQIRLVGNLANRRSYNYSDADAKKILRTLQQEVNALKARFQGDDGENSSIFSL
jgi:ABC-type Fe3+-hydroxamate transport system substrate-binding protein